TYDPSSRMLTADCGRYDNLVEHEYDFAGRLETESLTIATKTYTVSHEFDILSRPFKTTYPDGSVVERAFTDRSQLYTTSYLGTVVDTRTYDDGGRMTTSTYANTAVSTHAYRNVSGDKDNMLASISFSHPGTQQIGDYSYSWDENKNKTAETISGTMSGYGFSTGSTGYDDENRLTTWNRTNGTKNQSWTLSDVGNWSSFTSANSTWNRTHGPAHEFTSFSGASSGTLTYDVKGNLTSRPSTLQSPALGLTWDFENQLIGADVTDDTNPDVTFEYDALKRRVARSASSGNVVYIHSGHQVIAEYVRGANASSPSYRNVYGSYIDEPILRHAGTGTPLPTTGDDAIYYHRNQQYSIIALTDAAGTLIERYAYSAYGEFSIFAPAGTSRSTSSYNNRITYTGREWDATLALYFFRARWYDAAGGRFVSRDPSPYVDGMSLYRSYFCIRKVDPTGNLVWPITEGHAKNIASRFFKDLANEADPRILRPLGNNPNLPLEKAELCAWAVLKFLAVGQWAEEFATLMEDMAWTLVDKMMPLEGLVQQAIWEAIQSALRAIANGSLSVQDVVDAIKAQIAAAGAQIADMALFEAQLEGLVNELFRRIGAIGQANGGLIVLSISHEVPNMRAACTLIVAGDGIETKAGRGDQGWTAVGNCRFECQDVVLNGFTYCCRCGHNFSFDVMGWGTIMRGWAGPKITVDFGPQVSNCQR
ncbi:MAG TPA: RHS repeat-associated core domain-containing protein, partial [Pirellulaceae bacterium]|nr:RHS repeat-associated core domain-containing protein [Pirellulaceae bacterium]